MKFILNFFSKPIFTDRRFIIPLWCSVVIIALLLILFRGIPNNYFIFKYVFYHAIEQVNLYGPYPEYQDSNHYGPIFSLIIAPFAVLPDKLGFFLFGLFISSCLFFAIYKLPIDWKLKAIIYYISLQDMFVTTIACQTNCLIAALVIGSLICIQKEKEPWAACFIILGLFLKLYGIVGLAFFFFSKHKLKFIGYLVLWSIIFFVLPMLISSPQYIVQSYQDWYHALSIKNEANAYSMLQDYSVMGMVRRISGNRDISNMFVLIPAMLLFALQYIRINKYKDLNFQLGILASVLIFIVIFSSGSESPTYIIAMTGVAIWFILQKRPYSKYVVFLLIFTIIFTSFSTSDLLPSELKYFIKSYALKALPCFLIWLMLAYQHSFTRDVSRIND